MSVIVKGCGGENVNPEVQAQNIKMDDISTTYGIPARADGTTNKEQLQSNNIWLDGAKQKMSEELLPENIPYGKTVMGVEGEFSSSDSVTADVGAVVVDYSGGVPATNCMLEGYGAFIDGEEVVGSLPAQAYEITSVAIDTIDITGGGNDGFLIQDTYTNLMSVEGVFGGGRYKSSKNNCLAFIAGISGYIEFFAERGAGPEKYIETISAIFDGGSVIFEDISSSYDAVYYPSTLEIVVVGSPQIG